MVAASKNLPYSNISSPCCTLPRPPSNINLEVDEPTFVVTQDVMELQSSSSKEGTYDKAYNCKYNVNLISIDCKGSM
jgi:hypothetical protein